MGVPPGEHGGGRATRGFKAARRGSRLASMADRPSGARRDEKPRGKPRAQPAQVGSLLAGIVAPTLAARGLGQTSLIADWPEIVGAEVARFAQPVQLQWPPRGAKRDPDEPIAPATLVLRVDGAFALEAQHMAAIIVARVNAHLGWRCVDRLAFRQGPLPPPKPPAASRRAGAERRGAPARARRSAAPIADDGIAGARWRSSARAPSTTAARALDGDETRS